jgi:hypothetical protein
MAEGCTADARTVEGLTDARITGAGGKMYVKVSETYDLSTKPDKMGMLGIHTPDGQLIYSMWSGLYHNFSKMRFASCDVAMACASMLPADPLQIGVEAGDIAPQDMFNPILYKAVSNDSMSNLLNRIYAGAHSLGGTFIAKNSVTADNEPDFHYSSNQDIDQFAMYYGLLSDTSGWRKAMPQSGLEMRGLIPITWTLLATQGQPSVIGNLGGGSNAMLYPKSGEDSGFTKIGVDSNTLGRYMRGSSRAMPSFDTMVMVSDGTSNNDSSTSITTADSSGTVPKLGNVITGYPAVPGMGANVVVPNLSAPDCFVAAIVLPPAKLNRLYYRLKVTWTIEFSGPRPLTDLTNWFGLANAGVMSYGSDYETQSAVITASGKKEGMVDTGDVDITKIMEGSK